MQHLVQKQEMGTRTVDRAAKVQDPRAHGRVARGSVVLGSSRDSSLEVAPGGLRRSPLW